jgi:hypothetical protein
MGDIEAKYATVNSSSELRRAGPLLPSSQLITGNGAVVAWHNGAASSAGNKRIIHRLNTDAGAA